MKLSNASSKYGASLGRRNYHNEDAKDLVISFELIRLAWVDGDNDSGGAYWGHVFGDWMYRAYCEDQGIELWIRATSDENAKEQVIADYPKAEFTVLPPEDVSLEGEKTYWFSTSSGRIEIELTMEDAERVSHSGSCDDDVAELRQIPRITRQLEKIEEAVNAVRDGAGDSISVSAGLFGSKQRPYVKRFLDRDIGERVREATLLGWADFDPSKFSEEIEEELRHRKEMDDLFNRRSEHRPAE